MDLLPGKQTREGGGYAPQSRCSRKPRRHDSLAPGRRLRQVRPDGSCGNGMGKVPDRMAPLAARGHGKRQSGGNRKETFSGKTPRGAKILAARRETSISRMREVRIPAFAKINLRLDILGKRPDGYHELRTIFQSVSLHDELRLRASRNSGISLSIQGNAALSQEPLQKNLVYRAIDALRRELKIRSGAEIELRKTIPAGRGLGGGSSDAAAALLGYLRLTRRTLPLPRLLEIASSLGADVPFFLFGGRALGVSRGNEI